jgi:hypothetical protein
MSAMDGVPAGRAERLWAVMLLTVGASATIAWLGAIAYIGSVVLGLL